MTPAAMKFWLNRTVLASIGAAVMCLPVSAQAPGLAMLGELNKGQWELRFRDATPARQICVRTGRELVQISHRGKKCRRYIVEDGTDQVTVQYTCAGDGYGRTNIRRENPGLVQLQAQGIEGGLPFEFRAEARRIGACS